MQQTVSLMNNDKPQGKHLEAFFIHGYISVISIKDV